MQNKAKLDRVKGKWHNKNEVIGMPEGKSAKKFKLLAVQPLLKKHLWLEYDDCLAEELVMELARQRENKKEAESHEL